MKNPFSNKCPVCRSDRLKNPAGFMPLLYTMQPIVCQDCRAKFEPTIVGRIGLWLFITALFLFALAHNSLNQQLGKEAVGILFLVLLGLFFSTIVIAAIVSLFRPHQFTLWKDQSKTRAIVNYGSIMSILVYAAFFYCHVRV
jgi:hypothetical protein